MGFFIFPNLVHDIYFLTEILQLWMFRQQSRIDRGSQKTLVKVHVCYVNFNIYLH
jgi:hypothetical protein